MGSRDAREDALRSRIAALPIAQQFWLGLGLVLVLFGSFLATETFVVAAGFLAVIVGALIVRNPVRSIFAFILCNVFLVLLAKPKFGGATPAPTIVDYGFALLFAAIIGFWIVRMRIIQAEPLSRSLPQLFINVFAVWGLLVTAIGFINGNNTLNSASREILNLSPLLILPLLYERFIVPDSKTENRLLITVFVLACGMLFWNYFKLRTGVITVIATAQYGTPRGNSDETLAGLVTLFALSSLMSIRRGWRSWLLILLLVLALGAVAISFARTLYLATMATMILLLFMSGREERRRGLWRIFLAIITGTLFLIPIALNSRVIGFLISQYGTRLLAAQHLVTDLSLRARYAEWRGEWAAITHSLLNGYGFGAAFRYSDLLVGFDEWISFSHSSYLYIVFKTGFVGAVLFFTAYGLSIREGVKILRDPTLSLRTKIVVRACVGYLVLILIYAYSAPVLDAKTDMVWVGLIWGYFLALSRRMRHATLVEKLPFHAVIP